MPESPELVIEAFALSPGEAAEIAAITTKTLARLADSGTIPSRKLPSGHRRYRRSDAEALLTPPAGDSLPPEPSPAGVPFRPEDAA